MTAPRPPLVSDGSPSQQRPHATGLLTALGVLTPLPLPNPDPHSAAWARATLFFPLVGLLLGAALLGAHALLAPRLPRPLEALILVAAWVGLTRADTVRAWLHTGWRGIAGLGLAIGLLSVKAACLSAAGARPAALLFAPLLARWGMVVLATGARDADAPARKFNPGVTFSEFALASVFTIAVVLVLAEALGILVVVVVAAVLLSVRLLSHRWAHGVSWRLLLAATEGIETLVVLLIAAL
jgi:adenosylcobinamide-GDP ribazoletransferase